MSTMPVSSTPVPLQTPAGRASQATFNALLEALSRPGSLQPLPPGDALALLAAALLDLEVSAYASDEALGALLEAAGAHLVRPSEADFLFFAQWNEDALLDISLARVGLHLNPHRSATLILPAGFEDGLRLELSGPGVPDRLRLGLDVPAPLLHRFLELRREQPFPLGWDAVFTDGRRVLGLPRTTHVRVS